MQEIFWRVLKNYLMETLGKHGQSYAKYTYIFMMHGCDFINFQVDENRCKFRFTLSR